MVGTIRATTAVFFLVFLSACGGGGSSSSTPPRDTLSGNDGTGTGSNNRPPSSTFAVDTTARFNYPTDLALDSAGNLYVSDEGNQRIRKISKTGEVSSLPADTLYQTDLPVNRRRSNLAIDPSGNLYVLSPYYWTDIGERIKPAYSIHKVAPDGKKDLITYYPLETALRPYIPLDIATDAQGSLYILDGKDEYYYVSRRSSGGSGGIVTEYGGCCTAGHIKQFASDAQGNIAFIADEFSNGIPVHRIFTVPPSAQLSHRMVAEINGQTITPGVKYFDGMIYESNGDIYTVDLPQDANQAATSIRIMKTTSAGLTTVIYQGFPDGSTESRPLTSSGREPVGMVRAANGDFYISDPHVHAIYKITSSGQVSLVAGKPGEAGNSD